VSKSQVDSTPVTLGEVLQWGETISVHANKSERCERSSTRSRWPMRRELQLLKLELHHHRNHRNRPRCRPAPVSHPHHLDRGPAQCSFDSYCQHSSTMPAIRSTIDRLDKPSSYATAKASIVPLSRPRYNTNIPPRSVDAAPAMRS
jgi:hypothetical protein